jgi:hypothetical protein
MALPQTNAKPGLGQVGTASTDSIRAYRIAMKKMHSCGDDGECQNEFLKKIRIMENALLSDLNRKGTISVPQINANLKDWMVGDGQIKETERYVLAPIDGKGDPFVLAASYDLYSAVRVYVKNSEGQYVLKARLDNNTSQDYHLLGMRFVMINPKDAVFVTLFYPKAFDCFVWQFDGEKINEIWNSEARNLSFLRADDGGIVFSKDGWQVRYSWTNGSWVEQPLNIPAATPDVIGRLEMHLPASPSTISPCAYCS